MAIATESIVVESSGRGTVDISAKVQQAVLAAGVDSGLCHLWIAHTSASLIVCENADPSVRRDLERFFSRLVPDGDPMYEHSDEGPDDMPAHIRSILTQTSLSVPIRGGRCALGTWQGIYLWEHRHAPHGRRVELTILS